MEIGKRWWILLQRLNPLSPPGGLSVERASPNKIPSPNMMGAGRGFHSLLPQKGLGGPHKTAKWQRGGIGIHASLRN